MKMTAHQYIVRDTGAVRTEQLQGDRLVAWLYSPTLERSPALFRLLTGRVSSKLQAFLHYDTVLGSHWGGTLGFLRRQGMDFAECVEPAGSLRTARQIFERQIRYWQCRPMSDDPKVVASPADSRLLVGSLAEASGLWVKGKFFDLAELLGRDHPHRRAFEGGDFAVFRLTPDKYHYNHVPAAGEVVDFYETPGLYHSCNPGAVVRAITPFSKNKRVVTILDTDVTGGAGIGLVAMIEVAALMIGEVVQCYSAHQYCSPRPVERGMFLEKGQPKSLYRPGGSTDVLLFQPNRIDFAADLVANLHRTDVQSRFSQGFGRTLVETDVKVRSPIATRQATIGECDTPLL